jgi:deazaflavin-dependent oxidoreductase (nitroreductase family)
MPRPKVLALVMAGGEGSRLELLTERRAKPALPYAAATWRNRELIAQYDPEITLVLSADHVYRLDYGEVLARHQERGAGVTVVTSEVPEREASRQAVVEVAGDGRLSGFHYKPDQPPTTRVATEVFAFATRRLLDTLEELAGAGELQDFGHRLLPRLVEAGEAVEHRMAGYWRDVGTVPAYWQAHMDLLDPERPLDLDDPARPRPLRPPRPRGGDDLMDPDEPVLDSPTGWVSRHIRRYLDSDGANGHEWRPGVHTLLLTTRGRRSGKLHRTALIYGRDGDRYLVVASVGGSPRHPAWYLNLTADPEVRVQVGPERFTARARTATPEEKPRLWSQMTSIWPAYEGYQRKTRRDIPVVILERTGPG